MLKHIVFMLSAVFALSFLPAAFAADQGQKPTEQKGDQAQAQKFQEHKQHMLERIDHRIAALQKARGCVAQAQDKHALKECRPEYEHEGDHDRDRDHHDRDQSKSYH